MSGDSKRHKRNQSGAATIVMVILLALVVLPLIGMLIFEINRYQFIQRQLEKTLDAAALAGGTMLVDADTSAASDAKTATIWRQQMAIEAAKQFLAPQSGSKQTIVSIPLTSANSTQVAPGNALNATFVPNTLTYKIFPSDPDAGFKEVPVGSTAGRSITIQAYFNELPAFVQYLGLKTVPVYASASSGTPRIDIVLCLDMSASMDDSTRVSFVKRALAVDSAGQAELLALGPPPSPPNYTADCGAMPEAPSGPAPGPEPVAPTASSYPLGAADPGYIADYKAWQTADAAWQTANAASSACSTYNSCVQGDYDNYMISWNNWYAQYQRIVNDHQYIDYHVVASGQLAECLNNARLFAPDGYPVNVLAPQHLDKLQEPTVKNTWFQLCWNGTGGSANVPCTSPPYPGFDVMIANIGPVCIQNQPQPKGLEAAPSQRSVDAGPVPFTDGTYQFLNLPTVVEAAAGNLDPPNSFYDYCHKIDASDKLYRNTMAQYPGGIPAPQSGYKAAYERNARQITQPEATVLDAAKQFITALQGAGRTIRVGVAGFEQVTVQTGGGKISNYDGSRSPLGPGNGLEMVSIPGAGGEPSRIVPAVGLIPVSDTAALDQIIRSDYPGGCLLDKLYPMRGTAIGDGLQEAHDILANGAVPGRPSKQVIVLLTDGRNTVGQDPLTMSWYGANNQIPVYCVGLAQNKTVQAQMERELGDGVTSPAYPGVAALSGNGARYYCAPTAKDLRASLLNIARRLVRLAQ